MDTNNRQELRLHKDETIFIEVHSAYPGDISNCKLVICNSVDVSANGLKAQVDEKLPINAIYQLCVELRDSEEKMFLAGQIKWVVDAEDGEGYAIGVSIFESDDTDIEKWKRYIASEFAASKTESDQ